MAPVSAEQVYHFVAIAEELPSIIPIADKQPIFSGFPDLFVEKRDPTAFHIFCDRVTFGLERDVQIPAAMKLTRDWYSCITSLKAPGRYRLRFNQPFGSHIDVYHVVRYMRKALRFDSTVLEYRVWNHVPIRGACYLELALTFERGLGLDGVTGRMEQAYVPAWPSGVIGRRERAHVSSRTGGEIELGALDKPFLDVTEDNNDVKPVDFMALWRTMPWPDHVRSYERREEVKAPVEKVDGGKASNVDHEAGKAAESMVGPVMSTKRAADYPLGELLTHELICVALRGAPNHEMTLNGMFDWFRTHAPTKKNVQVSIRWHISANKAFRYEVRPASEAGASTTWYTLSPNAIQNGIQPTTTGARWLQMRQRQKLQAEIMADFRKQRTE